MDNVGELDRHEEVILYLDYSHLLVAHIHHIDAGGCVARSVAGAVQLVVAPGIRYGEDLLNMSIHNDDVSIVARRVCWIYWHRHPSLMTT